MVGLPALWGMMVDIEAKLARIGITGSLYKLYLTAVGLGGASVTAVAAKAGLPRTTAHDALAKLESEGLVRFVDHGKRRFVVAQEPGILLERLEARRQMLEDVMPVLRSMYHHESGQPNVRFHPGPEGIRTTLWDTLSGGDKVLRATLSMRELMAEPGLEEIERYLIERARRGIWLRVIRSAERDIAPIWPSSEEHRRELRYAPQAHTLSMTCFIYGNKVCLISSARESYGLIIDSAEFAAFQASMFDAMWSLSTPDAQAVIATDETED
ncbi:helix-turn-helix domain-containing protein [Rhodopseudomonas sp. HC1]|uniref:TrmB family transcriptional regulator n=1 Tax=Rhodopseudomonas infernalis TaxID=2897386 RepID=UPI001EE83A29|nr:helix-turn-helix domain-containing protein [Rhodopseudomonas infernalis]MCG6204967.1 helix-turn-helix domain-containing protein [Rhodopseudomonas infernalis]